MYENSFKRRDEFVYKQEQKLINDMEDMGVPDSIAEGIAFDVSDLARDVEDGAVIEDASLVTNEHVVKYKGNMVHDPATQLVGENDDTYMDGSSIGDNNFDDEGDDPPKWDDDQEEVSAACADSACESSIDDIVGPSDGDLDEIDAELEEVDADIDEIDAELTELENEINSEDDEPLLITSKHKTIDDDGIKTEETDTEVMKKAA